MKTLCLFNPENDMALAYGGPYYMPPANVCRMANDLATLPLWYAPKGSEVWLADERQREWAGGCSLLSDVQGVTQLSPFLYDKVCPWGWSASLVRRLLEKGIEEFCCPSAEQLEQIRRLSARNTAVEVLQKMNFSRTIGEAQRVDSLAECEYKGESFLLKAPWSGSGRGIQKVEGVCSQSLQGWISHILKTQGYLVKEPYYDKVVDFAMEFYADAEGAHFVGYSLFETDARGIYKENLLATDEDLVSRLSAFVSEETLQIVRHSLEKELSVVIGSAYEGYFGVDMMICRVSDGGYAVHPCVEINLRMNMGIVSRLLYDRHVSPVAQGRFVIEYYSRPGEALEVHHIQQNQYPLEVEKGKIRRGYLSLTPVFENTAYQAFICVD